MFRNKVLVRAAAASPLPPFLLRQLSLPAVDPIPAIDLQILCCRVSRRHRLACLPQAPADALLVFQRCQSRQAAEAVSEIVAAFPGASVGEEEELLCSGSLVAKAVECELRSMMLEHGWRCLGESIYVDSRLDQSEERSDLCAVNVEVRLGSKDEFDFVISPDVFRFTTHKISDVASSDMMEAFQQRKEVALDSCNFLTVCTTLPTLLEGHVIGYSKMLPSGQCFDKFMEFCSLKHGLDTNYNYHIAVKVTYGASLETKWLPSSFVLHGSGLQPAFKSIRASKALSSLQSFAELLKAWSFFGHNPLLIKEQLLLNCDGILPTWDKVASNLTLQTARADYPEDLIVAHTMSKDQPFILDFRTPKPAVHCSLSAKSWDTKAHKIAHSLDDRDNLSDSSPTNYGFESQPRALTSSYKSQVTLLKPSFSRRKPAEKRKTKHSSEPDADNSNKSSHPDAAASHANAVSSSRTILHIPSIQVSENDEMEHAELLKTKCQGDGGIAKVQQHYLEKKNLDTRNNIDYTPMIPEVTKAREIEKDVLTTRIKSTKLKPVVANDVVTEQAKRKAKQDVEKNVLTAVTKQKTMPEVVKDELKVRGHQNDELKKKVTKARAKAVDKDSLNSAMRTKSMPDGVNDELIAKVMDHHRRGELRLLTVADLKSFLGAKKAKVGGTKEVLIQRATELLG